MKKVLITEEQYCYILEKNLDSGNFMLSEGEINEGIMDILFRGCNNFKDFVKRISALLIAGTITAAVAIDLFHTKFPNATNEEESVMEQMIDNFEKKGNGHYNTQYAISQEGINHIKSFEKLSLKGYSATQSEADRGIVTVGFGHVIVDTDPENLQLIKNDFLNYLKTNPTDFLGRNYKSKYTISEKEAESLLKHDIQVCVINVKKLCVKANRKFEDPSYFNQGLMDAMISMMISGYGNFKASPFYKNLRNCRIKDGMIEQSDFNVTVASLKHSVTTQDGIELPGLANRRSAEYKLAMSDR